MNLVTVLGLVIAGPLMLIGAALYFNEGRRRKAAMALVLASLIASIFFLWLFLTPVPAPASV